MSMFTSTLPRAWANPVRRTVVWTTVVATIAWSIGLSFLINVPQASAAAPVLSGGGPPDTQQYVPADAIVDITSDIALSAGTVNQSSVTLKQCTGTDQSTSAAACATVGAQLCSAVAYNGAAKQIACTHSPLATARWHEFRVTTDVLAGDSTPLAAAVVRRFKTGDHFGGDGGSNTTLPRITQSFPAPGATDVPPTARLMLEFPLGPEGNMKTGASTSGSVENHNNFTLQAIAASTHMPAGTDLCGASGCTLTWDAATRRLIIDPTDMTSGTEYELSVSGLLNSVDQSLQPPTFFVRFTVGSADSAAPTLRANAPTNPSNGATGVSPFTPEVTVSFSESVNASLLSLSTVRLCQDSTADTAGCEVGDTRLTEATKFAFRYESLDRTAHLSILASDSLAASTKYCIEVVGGGSGVKDMAGNAFAATSSANCFTTGSATDPVTGGPRLLFADADNFKLVARFSEAVKDGSGANGAENAANYTFECPVGVTVNLTGKTIVYSPENNEVEIQGLGLQPDQSCRLTVATTLQDLAGNNFDNTGTPANNIANFRVLNNTTTGGFLGTQGVQSSDFFGGMGGTAATFWEKPQRCQPRNSATNKVTTLECEFPAPAALATGSTFTLTFPSGFTMNDGTNNTRAIPTTSSYMNSDINGPAANAVTIASVTVNNGAKTAIVATGGGAIASGDMIRFEFDRLTTPTIPATDQRIQIIVKDADGVKVGQTIQAAPFSINQAGSLTIAGKVCKGTTSGGTCGGSDTGIANVKVMCDQMGGFMTGTTTAAFMGHQEATTNAQGVFSITGLTTGQYGCNIPPDPTNMVDTGGMPPFQQVSLSATGDRDCGEGTRSDCVDFKYTDLSVTGKTLTVNVIGLNDADADADDFDVFCHAGATSFEFSAPVMKAVDAATAGTTTTTLKLQGGKTYECGMGPHMAFEQFGNGAPPPPPTFDFMPPKPVQVVVPSDANPTAITFTVATTNRTISGSVVDGSATGIANVFVHAAPVGCFDGTTGEAKECFGSFAQTKPDGTFTLNVADGTYEIGADGPGLPPSTREIATANGANVSGITLKMVKSSTTISGQVLDESGNGIKYAHVNGERRTITSGTDACNFANSTPAGGWADSPTDESGNYTLYAAVGTWCVRAFAPSYGEVGTKTVTISGTTSQSGQNIQATSANFGTISGTVTKALIATGGGFINCFSPGTGGNGAPTNADGTYSLRVKLPSSGTATYTCDGFMPGVGNLGRQTTTLGGATTTATVDFAIGNPGTISVTIANITDAFCDARDSSGFGSPAGRASSTGVYTINVPAGTYTVRCGGPKYGRILEQASVVVTAGGTATVTGTAPTTRTVAGRVTDGTSNVAGATLTFTDTTGKSFSTTTGSQTGTNTNLSLTGVPEGAYTLTASKKSFEPASTTATVSGGNLTLSSPIALAPMAADAGDDVKIRIQESASNYTGDAKVIATKGNSTVVTKLDATTGLATAELTNGTWTVKAIGDNGKESASTTVTVTSGDAVNPESAGNYDKTLSLATSISGYTQKSGSETMSLSGGGLAKFGDLAVGGKTPEINVPASTLSTTDSSTGKIEMKSDPTLKDIDPGTDTNFVGSYGYDITPKDANGNAITTGMTGTVTITLPYTDADVSSAGVTEEDMKLGAFNTSSQTWETFPTTVDTTNNLLVAQVNHFSSFGVIGTASSGSPSSTSDATPPAAVASPRGSATTSAVTLTWSDPSDSDLDSVEVLRSNPPSTAVSGTPLSRVAKGTQRYVDSSVSASTAYTYILRSRDRSGNTRNSGEIAVTTPAAPSAAPAPAVVTAPPAATTTAPPAVTTPAAPAPTAPGLAAIGLNAGDLVRSPSARTIYLVGADGKRYVYPNEVTYKSWHADFSSVKSITDSQIAQLSLGGTVTVRPGTWLVKIESDPKVYAVEPGGTLRWVETEARARLLYGTNWNKQIIDVPVSYWPAYREGTALGADRHPTGTVVRSGSQTYYIDAGKKRLVATDAFSTQGFQNRFVRTLSTSIVYEDGPALSSSANLKFASR